MALAMSFFFAPAASKALIKRSRETVGSLASIFATRDWLERRRLASSLCDKPLLMRHSFKLALSASLTSTKAVSSGVRLRKSRVEPTFHPAASSFLRLSAFIIFLFARFGGFVGVQAAFAICNYVLRRLSSCLAKNLKNDYSVAINPINDPPALLLIRYTQFVTRRAYTRHRS